MIQHKSVDTVCISVPPREQMTQVVRLATTAVASRAGFNIDQADDLSTAVDELFHVSLAHVNVDHADFCICYYVLEDRIEIRTAGCASFADEADNVGRYSRFLLESLSDGLEERPNPDGGFDVVLVKLLEKS